MKRGDPELTFTLRGGGGGGKHARSDFHYGLPWGSESDESTTPRKKMIKTHPFSRLMDHAPAHHAFPTYHHEHDRSCSSGDEAAATAAISPSTPPIFNHRNARRRKGIPHRAPF